MQISAFRYLRKALTQPPQVTARQTIRKLRGILSARLERRKALLFAPLPAPAAFGPYLLENTLDLPAAPELSTLLKLVPFWLDHRFDLLGSGWVRWDGSGPFPGAGGKNYAEPRRDALENLPPAHRAEAARLRALIPVPGYTCIDWQRDVKSGYRFNEGAWCRDQPVGLHPGADIKLPWEIGRLQHFPQMAVAARALQDENPSLTRRLLEEYQAQTLDFFAANPPDLGAQWACTMDVGIRAANLVLARELFAGLGGTRPGDVVFDAELAQALLRHGRFIAGHLEWSETFTSNHYLADICGLLFVAAALAPAPETNAWLAFACDQLSRECVKHFYADGVNFEASTSYHRLSLEMAVTSLALLCAIPASRLRAMQKPDVAYLPAVPRLSADWPTRCATASATGAQALVPQPVWARMARAAQVTAMLTKPDGNIAQIGDNDSGRFLRLTVSGQLLRPEETEKLYANLQGYVERIKDYRQDGEEYFDENMLDHRAALGLAEGLFDLDPVEGQGFALERALTRALSHGCRPGYPIFSPTMPAAQSRPWEPVFSPKPDFIPVSCREYKLYSEAAQETPLSNNGSWRHFPQAGWHIYRSGRIFLCINAGDNGQNGNGGHAHNDRLHIELQIDGRDILRDPGTALYTPSPTLRNAYRSSSAHNGPCPKGEEQNRFAEDDLFQMRDEARAFVCECGKNYIVCALKLRQGWCIRRVEVAAHTVSVYDCAAWSLGESAKAAHILPFSPGYGKQLACPDRASAS